MNIANILKYSFLSFKSRSGRLIFNVIIIAFSIALLNLSYLTFSELSTSLKSTITDNAFLKKIQVKNSSKKFNKTEISKIQNVCDTNFNIQTCYYDLSGHGGIFSEYGALDTFLLPMPDKAIQTFNIYDKPLSDNEIIISNSVKKFEKSQNMDMNVGDNVTLLLSNTATNREVKFKIVGFYDDVESADQEVSLNRSIISMDFGEKLLAKVYQSDGTTFNPDHFDITSMNVIIRDSSKLKEVSDAFNAIGFNTDYSLKQATDIPDLAKLVAALFAVLGIVILVFSLINTINIFSGEMKLRTKEYGIMRAVGFARTEIFSMVLVELGYLSIIGIIFIYFFSIIFLFLVNKYLLAVFSISNSIISLDINLSSIIFCILVLILFIYLPSINISMLVLRKNILDSIKYQS